MTTTPKLEAYRKARRRTERARAAEHAALLAAREEGASYAELGRMAGISRQAVRQLLRERDASER